MLSKEQNELVAKVGPGTPMGELMRQYWIPGLLSSELAEPDGRPVRVRLLGEDLIAFRATAGTVGIVQNNCPHRGASLFFGRNEEDGLRCVYHGWKFDVAGACVDMPNEPAESRTSRTRCSAIAYPTQERGGMVWAYMGPRDDAAAAAGPRGRTCCRTAPASRTSLRECNWMQALEGDIDTSHLGFLHLGSVAAGARRRRAACDYYSAEGPRAALRGGRHGLRHHVRRLPAGRARHVLLAHRALPLPVLHDDSDRRAGLQVRVRAWVPIDDDHTMFWSMKLPRKIAGVWRRGRRRQAASCRLRNPMQSILPNTTDWLGRWR